MGRAEGAVEDMGLNPDFWRGRRVFLTGHTGFKGAWMLVMLRELGAVVTGFALPPASQPNLFDLLGLDSSCTHVIGDVRDLPALDAAMVDARPEVVIHMAAQALVRESYNTPVETYAVNVMGTVNVLDACRRAPGVRAAVVVTTDKCYENLGWHWGYREIDRLGGHDPYSNSKAAAELVVDAYRSSFFSTGELHLASARAGNVIGGCDFADDRIVPDAIRAFVAQTPLMVRNPLAVRPWQHVLEPVYGYLLLAERLFDDRKKAGGWNFGPAVEESVPVGEVADTLAELWGEGARWELDSGAHPHEAHTLKLDSSKARIELGWVPRFGVQGALAETCSWYRAMHDGADMPAFTVNQVREYLVAR